MSICLFLIAYAASGFAGLVYEIGWMRILALLLGHSTAASGTVLAAFMGGLSAGSLIGGRLAARWTRRQALVAYAGLECAIGACAYLVPVAFRLLSPALAWAYRDGDSHALFIVVRLAIALIVLTLPAMLIGATFPTAMRWFASERSLPARYASFLYAANCTGATAGALAAGFFLIPSAGISGTLGFGALGSLIAAAAALLARRVDGDASGMAATLRAPAPAGQRHAGTQATTPAVGVPIAVIAATVSGAAAILLEVVWMRVLALEVAPTTFAFSATVAIFVLGAAVGGAIGGSTAMRSGRPAIWIAVAFATAGTAVAAACAIAGQALPLRVAEGLAAAPLTFNQQLPLRTLGAAALMLPAAACLGAVLPLTIGLLSPSDPRLAQRLSVLYALNTLGAAGASLTAAFLAIPLVGLEMMLRLTGALLAVAAAAMVVAGLGTRTRAAWAACLPCAAVFLLGLGLPRWNQALVAGGGYKYAAYAQPGADLESALTAGSVLYQHDGAAATVAVRRLTGELSLSIDGKVDASNGSDMLTQKMLSHLPLLLHPDPSDVAVIGLGSGVTLAAALTHPIRHADVIELLPDVVIAAGYFSRDNHGALGDQRVRLIEGDGRSHLELSSRRYDVIISEPSNPWMSGVAALFTREFFDAARRRLAPGGLLCQWAHTYDMAPDDLSSIVATFHAVFPDGTMWLVGRSDLLLVGGTTSIDERIAAISTTWERPGVADDLRRVGVMDPSAIWSMFVGQGAGLQAMGRGTSIQVDDRMALEFSGPTAVGRPDSSTNVERLLAIRSQAVLPQVVQAALASIDPAAWSGRGAMLLGAGDFGAAFDDYAKATTLGADDSGTLDGLVKAAAGAHREADAVALVKRRLEADRETAPLWIAASRLLAASGDVARALAAAREAVKAANPPDGPAVEHLAELLTDAGDAKSLEAVVQLLQDVEPHRAAAAYYQAVSRYVQGQQDAALSFLDQAERRDPGFVPALTLRGAILAQRNETGQAQSALTRAIELDPRDVSAYVNLGLLALKTGKPSVAKGYFSEALSLDPKSGAARQGLATATGAR